MAIQVQKLFNQLFAPIKPRACRNNLPGSPQFGDPSLATGTSNGADGSDTLNTVIGTNSGEYLAVLLNTSPGSVTAADFLLLGV